MHARSLLGALSAALHARMFAREHAGLEPAPPLPTSCGTCRCQVLILSPTRELAQQTEKVILAIGEFINVQAHACVGGKSLGE